MKKEINYKTLLHNESIWLSYQRDRFTKWAHHHDLFNIWYDKPYGDKLHRLTRYANIIRIMLYTNQLLLNLHEYQIMNDDRISSCCTHS